MTTSQTQILVVDDDQTLLSMISEALTSAGFHVTMAEDGRAATLLTDAKKFDVIVTDLVMPHVAGLEFVGNARAGTHNSTTPVIVVSGVTDEQMISKAKAIGVITVLSKPFRIEDLVSTVKNAAPAPNTSRRPSQDYIALFTEAATSILEFYFGERATVKQTTFSPDYYLYSYISAQTGYTGASAHGFLTLGLSQGALHELSTAVFRSQREALSDQLACDLAAEVVNQMGGVVKSGMARLGSDVDFTLPSVTLGLGHKVIRKNMPRGTRLEMSVKKCTLFIDFEVIPRRQ